MKNKLSNRLWKTISIALLTVILTVGVLYVTEIDGNGAYAADVITTDVTPENVDYKLIKYSDISAYRVKDATTDWYGDEIPQYNDSNGEWLFAGWYSDDKLSGNIGTDKTSGEAVAKFVPADVLSVKCQISKGTDANSDSTVLRCVSSVDTLKYNYIGFDLTVPEDSTFETENMESDRVGSRIEVAEENAKDAYAYSPKVIDTESEYFFSATYDVVKSDKETFDTRYFVQPYWITKDGTKVYGVSRYVTVNEGITKKTIHATVKMEDVACGMSYDGSEVPTLEKINHDGTYAYYAITVPDKTVLNSVTKFNFYDTDDNLLGTYYYRNLLKTYNGENADQSWYTAYEETTEDEFVIATNADLYGLTSAINGDHTFASEQIYVVSDIVANKGKATEGGWDKTQVEGGTEQVEGGTEYPWVMDFKAFNGILDGQGHTISGINAKKDEGHRAALFTHVGTDGIIKNLTLKNSYFESKEWSGSIAGRLDGSIYNISSDAIVKATVGTSGGLIGTVYAPEISRIENCNFSGSVSANDFAGGIVGKLWRGNLKFLNCAVSGTVTTTSQAAGGILGAVARYDDNCVVPVEVEKCQFQGDIVNTAGYAGGIIASALNQVDPVKIMDCVVSGTIKANKIVGGIIGHTGTGQVDIQGSTFAGTIEAGDDNAGGFIGVASGSNTSINDCKFTGIITSPQEYVGGIVGRTASGFTKIANSCFNGKLNVVYDGGGIVGTAAGKTEIVNCTSSATSSITNTGSGEVWSNTGGCVGRIQAEVSIMNSSFSSTLNSTYRTGGLVGWVRTGSATINNSSFTGKLTATTNVGGIIGRVRRNVDSEKSPDVVIINSYTEGTLSATGHYAGGLVGYLADGTVDIKGSFSSMNFDQVTSNQKGGLIGYVYKETTSMNVSLTDCLNSGTVQGYQGIGGLIGGYYSGSDGAGILTMTRCLNMGVVKATQRVGTVIGWSWSTPTVTNVYATKTSTATGTDIAYNNHAYGTFATDTTEVTKYDLVQVTVGNGVSADNVKSNLSGLFGAENTVWTIGTTDGSTPKLNLTTQ